MVKVYTPEGIEEDKEPVDACECVERCGYSYEPPEPVVVETDDSKKAKKPA